MTGSKSKYTTTLSVPQEAEPLNLHCRIAPWGGGAGRGGGERVTRAYTVEVQTASVFYAQSLILLSLMAVKHGHTR